MTMILKGVRILEVAEHTFVPAASALLADLGAEVIKIEHVTRGDAMRGLASSGIAVVPGNVHVLLEHSNRGKKSLGLDLTAPDGIEILYKLAATSDVFLTNKLPSVRERLKIDVDQIRARNPRIIYVRGTGQGERGPDADKGSYDSLAFWARAGVAMGAKRPEYDLMPVPPAPGFGDSIGGMTIAGGIMGALFYRERTGQGTVVDVSLFGTGLWAMGQAMALSLVLKVPWSPPPATFSFNPLTRNYATKDGRQLAFTCLQAAKYWPMLCDVIERPELKDDARFADQASLLKNSRQAIEILVEVFASATLEEWRQRLEAFEGQWCVVQDTLEAAADPQTLANGYLQECQTSSGIPFRLVAAPVQYDERPAKPARAPEFNEHGDAILGDLGLDLETIIDLKARGVVA
jgi:crotonobetainyl-CoA:carnitine CoA-transferase CaiB-like acyl-CoA transferase